MINYLILLEREIVGVGGGVGGSSIYSPRQEVANYGIRQFVTYLSNTISRLYELDMRYL
jgi:hypothetical protein